MENRVLAYRGARTFNRAELMQKIDWQNKHYGTVCTLTNLTANFNPLTSQLEPDGNDDNVEGC